MKPKSKGICGKTLNSGDKASSSYDFTAMSEALLNSDVSIKNHSPSNVGAAHDQGANSVQPLSQDCYDFTGLSETLNNIEKENVNSKVCNTRVRKVKLIRKVRRTSQIFSSGSGSGSGSGRIGIRWVKLNRPSRLIRAGRTPTGENQNAEARLLECIDLILSL